MNTLMKWAVACIAALCLASGASAQQTVYYGSSHLSCPNPGEKFRYFFEWEDIGPLRSGGWCGAAAAGLAYWAQFDPYPWRVPYALETCVAGDYYTYSHPFPDGSRWYSGPYSDIYLACEAPPPVPPPPLPPPEKEPEPPPPEGGTCPAVEDPAPSPDGTEFGNPVIPATGEKTQTEIDYQGTGPHALSLVRTFRSGWSGAPRNLAVNAGLGTTWSHNHAISVNLSGTPTTASAEAWVVLGNGA